MQDVRERRIATSRVHFGLMCVVCAEGTEEGPDYASFFGIVSWHAFQSYQLLLSASSCPSLKYRSVSRSVPYRRSRCSRASFEDLSVRRSKADPCKVAIGYSGRILCRLGARQGLLVYDDASFQQRAGLNKSTESPSRRRIRP